MRFAYTLLLLQVFHVFTVVTGVSFDSLQPAAKKQSPESNHGQRGGKYCDDGLYYGTLGQGCGSGHSYGSDDGNDHSSQSNSDNSSTRSDMSDGNLESASGSDKEESTPSIEIMSGDEGKNAATRIINGEEEIRGVCLGGWLVFEKWMVLDTDPIYSPGDLSKTDGAKGEYNLITNSSVSPDIMRSRFDQHMAEFITKEDIKAIADVGLNAVRVPVGFWIRNKFKMPQDELANVYPTSTIDYLDRLVLEWAVEFNIGVIFSIHAARGSQNGMDHSSPNKFVNGSGVVGWYTEENIADTVDLVKFIVQRYLNAASFLGIGILNEPQPDPHENTTGLPTKLRHYHKTVVEYVREEVGSDIILMLGPTLALQTPNATLDLIPEGYTDDPNVQWAQHPYWGFNGDGQTAADVFASVQNETNLITKWNSTNKIFFGEWSLAASGNFSSTADDFLVEFASAQSDYLNQFGWTFWSWRVGNNTGPWSFKGMMNVEADGVTVREAVLGSQSSASGSGSRPHIKATP